MIMGAAAVSAASCWATSNPDSSPRRISMSTTSGRRVSTRWTASAQLPATPATVTPSDSSTACAASRNDASSSTITQRNVTGSACQRAAPSTLQLAGVAISAGLQVVAISAGLKESEYGQHPAVNLGGIQQAELHHDAAHVLFHRA